MLAILSSLLLVLAAIGNEPKLVRPIELSAAKATARVEHKPILAAFRDADSPDCKKLDTTTWVDRRGKGWLDTKVIAVEVDVAKEPDLARRMRIRHLPTFVVMDERGNELDRIVGYRDLRALKAEAEPILAGADPVERWKKTLAAHPDDPDLRFDHAGFLADRGALDDALREYLWCFDHGVEKSAAFAEVRNGALLDELRKLGQLHPPTLRALTDRAAAAEKQVIDGTAGDAVVSDYVTLCRLTGEEARVLNVWDALDPASPSSQSVRERLAPWVRDLLYVDARYAELVPLLGDVRAALERRIAARKDLEARLANEKPADVARKLELALKTLVEDTARDYECLLAVNKLSEAAILSERLLDYDWHGPTWVALVKHARRAHADDEAVALWTRAKSDKRLSRAEVADVRTAVEGLKLP